DCDDGNACTVDSCGSDDICDYTYIDGCAGCTDHSQCGEGKYCSDAGDCVSNSCVDSDGGNNSFVFGTVTYTSSLGLNTMTDVCHNGTVLNETLCSGTQPVVTQTICNDGCNTTTNTCIVPVSCSNNIKDGSETDVDCGGSCPACPSGKNCTVGTDCISGVCEDDVCVVPSSTQTISLEPGWNLIGISVIPQSTSLLDVFEEQIIEKSLVRILNYENGIWRVYNSDVKIPTNLYQINKGKAYWVNVNSSSTLIINGTLPTDKTQLVSGWNLIGIETESNTTTVSEYFEANILSKIIEMYSFENNAYVPLISNYIVNATNNELERGIGYWVRLE
ncbi:hypothetical protein KY334_01650, partial [Candidatus Woesearchaeota archaeon]|nr:hypothetical protein [Candidatus Woesearchaeota archaeon]